MIDYTLFSKDELIKIIRVLLAVNNNFIDSFDKIIDEFQFLDKIAIDCPEKRIFFETTETGRKNLTLLADLNKSTLIKGKCDKEEK